MHSYGAMDFENKRNLHWSSLYRRILPAGREGKTASSVLESWDALEKRLTKWEVCRVAKELRKFGHIKSALEVIYSLFPCAYFNHSFHLVLDGCMVNQDPVENMELLAV